MPPIRIDGPVVTGTRRNLINGVRDTPLPEAAADAVIAQSREFLQKVVDAYDAEVSVGEVGEDGSAQAGDDAPVSGRCPTGLLYGRVQSGKTAGMIAATALALDNGFRVVVIVTANNVTLVKQTATRFKALAGPAVLSTAVEGEEYEWEGRVDDLRQDLPTDGLVLVCAKDATHLPAVISLFQELDAGGFPALILDDEADAATPDTTIAARSTGRPNAPQHPSATYRHVIENTMPGEEGESIREVFSHHVYVQVTATPFVLLLQRPDSPIRPTFIQLMTPGAGYRGGEAFFGAFDPTQVQPAPPIVLVANTESQALLSRRNAPTGLSTSMEFFLLSAATLYSVRGRFPDKGFRHLAHTSRLTTHHDHVADVINRHLRALRQILRDPRGQEALDAFDAAYAELMRTDADVLALDGVTIPALGDLLEIVAANISQAEVIKVNANTGEPQYGPTFNFVVGGDILGRGVTISDLLVTYYLREAQTSQMDTVWQHGRMFGYRERLMPYTRVFLPQHLASLFKGIHEAEESLREVLQEVQPGDPIPISVVPGTRSNRPNAVEPFAVQVYRPGTQIFPRYVVSDPALVARSNPEILAIVQQLGAPMTEPERANRFLDVPFDDVIAIARLLPVRDTDDGRWRRDAVVSVLEAIRSTYGDTAVLYVRSFEGAADRRLQTGVLSGEEVALARQFERPVLALVYRGDPNAPDFWYGSLFLPDGMETQVFNANP